ncbi:1,4-dihydroxy-6-naphthoate synthase [Desulfovibrio sp. ZJ369]|uniref:1,4-dihydroxy-6-naphthoate synthase n=1 Tax=Desulfovibrio sp. ZJ369 TaxID=2709793 RepID=UPI0013ED5FC3|nr:1,4-dihydroxy-6-naphthoate synthase [Desulfovibrio sp. ZJ369]
MAVSLPGSLSLGLSPCPNDTCIFHALLHGLIPAPAAIRPYLADVERLNSLARQKKLDVTKMSLGAAAQIMDDYALLASGAALGWGCGPLVVAREALPPEAWRTARVAVPGLLTTANLLLTLHGGFQGPRQEMLFSQVMPAVARGDADLGVIIHEGRFTFERMGLVKLLDLGQWWEGAFHLPLPLGAIAVRRDLPLQTARAMQAAIADSLAYARAHPEACKDFVRSHAQEMEDSVIRAHIETFVTDFSLDLGEAGRRAIEALVSRAAALLGRELPARGLFLE